MAREVGGVSRAPPATRPARRRRSTASGATSISSADYPAVFETQNDALALFRVMSDGGGGGASCLQPPRHHAPPAFRLRPRARDVRGRRCKGFREAGDLKWQARVISNIGNVEIQLGNHTAGARALRPGAGASGAQIERQRGRRLRLRTTPAFGHIQQALQHRATAATLRAARSEAESALTPPRPLRSPSRASSATSDWRPSACRPWARPTRRCRAPMSRSAWPTSSSRRTRIERQVGRGAMGLSRASASCKPPARAST